MEESTLSLRGGNSEVDDHHHPEAVYLYDNHYESGEDSDSQNSVDSECSNWTKGKSRQRLKEPPSL